MKATLSLVFLIVSLTLGFAEDCPRNAPRSALSEVQVRETLSARFPLPGAVLSFPSMTSRCPSPPLMITEVLPLNDKDVMVRMSCRNPFECLSFYAFLHWPQPYQPEAILTDRRARRLASPEPQTVRAGTQATLMLEGQFIQITTPVICLEPGRVGDTVRASSMDGKRIYLAKVMSPGFLKAAI